VLAMVHSFQFSTSVTVDTGCCRPSIRSESLLSRSVYVGAQTYTALVRLLCLEASVYREIRISLDHPGDNGLRNMMGYAAIGAAAW
jgi:hypothetical protein